MGHIGYALAGVATELYQAMKVQLFVFNLCNYEHRAFSCLYLLKKDGEYKEISLIYVNFKKHPLAISLLIILFSLAGVPPLGGFLPNFMFSFVLENKMYASNYWTTNNSYVSILLLKIIKIMYFDDSLISLSSKNRPRKLLFS